MRIYAHYAAIYVIISAIYIVLCEPTHIVTICYLISQIVAALFPFIKVHHMQK